MIDDDMHEAIMAFGAATASFESGQDCNLPANAMSVLESGYEMAMEDLLEMALAYYENQFDGEF